MGMPISVHLRGDSVSGAAAAAGVAAVFAELRVVDAIFSTYRADSDVMRLNRKEVDVAGCHPDVGVVIDLCGTARLRTGGAFDPELPAPAGGTWFDPSGLVKGWAVERAAGHLAALADPEGLDFCLNAGGDVIVGTATDDAPAWRVGIEDPTDLGRVLCVLPLRAGGVATSGSAHRGHTSSTPAPARRRPRCWPPPSPARPSCGPTSTPPRPSSGDRARWSGSTAFSATRASWSPPTVPVSPAFPLD